MVKAIQNNQQGSEASTMIQRSSVVSNLRGGQLSDEEEVMPPQLPPHS